MRARRLWAVVATTPLLGCNGLLDLDVSYADCVDPPGKRYAETFDDRSFQDLRDRCWRVSNVGYAPSGVGDKIFLEDGDLVMRTEYDSKATDRDEWTATDQAPFFHRRVEGDFLLVARVEASSKASADHCLPDRNSAGLALRPSSGDAAWLTWTVEPYIWDHGATKAACEEDADDTNNPTARLRLRTPAKEAPTVDDVGLDGEADIGLCRVGSEVFHYFRSPTQDLTTDGWSPGGASAATMPGVLDLGLTATGSGAEYQAAGHFNWVVFERGTWGDGCTAALERFQLPEADPK